jgi:hypothetical protein
MFQVCCENDSLVVICGTVSIILLFKFSVFDDGYCKDDRLTGFVALRAHRLTLTHIISKITSSEHIEFNLQDGGSQFLRNYTVSELQKTVIRVIYFAPPP